MRTVVFALVGGAVGAIIWAVVCKLTDYEIGYVAWGVGLLVGLGAKLGGASSKPMGVVAASIALASIFAGKMLFVFWVFQVSLGEADYRAAFEDYRKQVEAFSLLESDSDATYAQFMIDHEFTGAETPADVTPEDLVSFRAEAVPEYRKFAANPQTYEEWHAEFTEGMNMTLSNSTTLAWTAVVNNLNAIDLLFAGFGILTAYRLASGREEAAAA